MIRTAPSPTVLSILARYLSWSSRVGFELSESDFDLSTRYLFVITSGGITKKFECCPEKETMQQLISRIEAAFNIVSALAVYDTGLMVGGFA